MQAAHVDVVAVHQGLQRARGGVNFGGARHEHKHIAIHATRQLHRLLRGDVRHIFPRGLAAILNVDWKSAPAGMHMLRVKRFGKRLRVQGGAHDNKG